MTDEIEAATKTAKAVHETSKLGRAVIEAGSDLARYFAKVLGTVPEDLVGLAFGDYIHIKRAEIASTTSSTPPLTLSTTTDTPTNLPGTFASP